MTCSHEHIYLSSSSKLHLTAWRGQVNDECVTESIMFSRVVPKLITPIIMGSENVTKMKKYGRRKKIDVQKLWNVYMWLWRFYPQSGTVHCCQFKSNHWSVVKFEYQGKKNIRSAWFWLVCQWPIHIKSFVHNNLKWVGYERGWDGRKQRRGVPMPAQKA